MSLRGYVPEIDGLRAIAVGAVMAYHLFPNVLPGGFAGVDVFFVISGYVVSSSLARDAGKPLFSYLLHFYVRRMLRILPALMVCLVATAIATTLFIPDAWLSNTTQVTARYAFFGLSNIALVWTSDGYFSPRAELNPFIHTWSLGVEEQFYLLFPFVFFLWLSLGTTRTRFGWIRRYLLGGLIVVSLAYSAMATVSSPDKAFYYLPSRFWELASGALLFQLQSAGIIRLHSKRSTDLTFFLGLACVALSYGLPGQKPFPLPWALLPVCGALLVIAAVTSGAGYSAAPKQLGRPVFVGVGKLSYSLYLWHWPVNVLFRWTVGLDSPLLILLALATSVVLSYLSYRAVEIPMRTDPAALVVPGWRVAVSGLLSIFLCWTLANKIFATHKRIGLSVTKDEHTWYSRAWSERSSASGCKSEATAQERDGMSVFTFRRVSCKEPPQHPRHLFVVGDSQAGAYGTMLYKLAQERGTEVVLFMKAGCAYMSLHRPTESRCAPFVDLSTAEILRRAVPGDVVFLASLRVPKLSDQTGNLQEAERVAYSISGNEQADRSRALDEAHVLLGRLDKADLQVVIDAPKPVFKSPAFRCSDWFNSMNGACSGGLAVSRDFLLEHRRSVMRSLTALSAANPRLLIWDPFPVLCPEETCKAVDARGPLFFDGDHLSALGNRVLYPSFLSTLDMRRVKRHE